VWLDSKELRDQLNQVAIDHYGSQYSETLAPENNNNESAPLETEESKEEVPAEKNEPFSEDDIPF
jgi:hypothetical protein